MTWTVDRRGFLRTVVVSAGALGLSSISTGCSSSKNANEVFPQSLASGDPKPSSVLLWTRVAPGAMAEPEVVQYEVALDDGFSEIVASGEIMASAQEDHTIRILLTDLSAYTTYYYRFVARGTSSRTGRTKTAPQPDQDVNPRFAFASCQDYVGRYYHSYRVLAEQEEDVDFVVFLGDYIYEWELGTNILNENLGEDRRVDIPDGLEIELEGVHLKTAVTLADYRGLYKQYKQDPDLQRAHELFPFIVVWDDHEFANDAWQDHAVDFADAQGDEKSPERRAAATQAWHEFIPVDISLYKDRSFPEDITIYRSFRYGKHLELALTDQRYYRSDHVIPEGPVDQLVGKTGENTAFGARIFAQKPGFDVREAESEVSMLGDAQREWLLDTLTQSDATWKFWGSQTLVAEMMLDLRNRDLAGPLDHQFYFKLDHWDGFRSERAQLLGALKDTENLVVVSGDIHGFYAAELQENFDEPGEPAAVEFTVSGISSAPLQEQMEQVIANNVILEALGLGDLIKTFDTVLQESGPHYRYASSATHGIAIVEVRGT